MDHEDSALGPELERAFDALVEVSARLVREGRGPRAAAVKVALQRHIPNFSEQQLGFATFRSFLQVAEQAGRVQLRPAPQGPDIDVVPIGVDLPPSVRAANRLRRDIWDAFTRWDEGFLRFWDRETEQAFRIPEQPVPAENEEQATLRAELQAGAARFIPIEHVPAETLIQWAQEFADGLPPDPARTALLVALNHDLPIHNFTQLVRRLGLGPRWHDTHVSRVRQVVDRWAKANKLEIDLARELEASGPGSDQIQPIRTHRAQASSIAEEDLRRRVHEMVDEMTLPELLGLTIPLRLVFHAR